MTTNEPSMTEEITHSLSVQYELEQHQLTKLQAIIWSVLEDDNRIVGFDRISDSEFGVEMKNGVRCFITIELA